MKFRFKSGIRYNAARLRKNEEGATAIEFALVAIPFFFMIIGIIEMSMMFTAQSLLEASTAHASRQIRTGAVQQGGGEEAFRNALCDYADVFIPCASLQYQVVALDNFGEAQGMPPPSFDEDGNLQDQSFNAGDVNDVIMIRTAYAYPIMTPLMQPVLTNNNGNRRLMISTVVLKTEPYEF